MKTSYPKGVKELCSVDEICKRLGISKRCFYSSVPKMVRAGIKPMKLVENGKKMWFYFDDVCRFLQMPK